MPAGRPTQYTPELVEKAKAYLENYETEHNDAIPSVAGLCSALSIHRSTAYDWAKDEEKEFSDILEQILIKQEQILISKGLTGIFNSNITKLVLGKHGYHDKQDTNVEASFNVTMPTKDASTL